MNLERLINGGVVLARIREASVSGSRVILTPEECADLVLIVSTAIQGAEEE